VLSLRSRSHHHRFDLDDDTEAPAFDVEVRRQMIIRVDTYFAIVETADRRHLAAALSAIWAIIASEASCARHHQCPCDSELGLTGGGLAPSLAVELHSAHDGRRRDFGPLKPGATIPFPVKRQEREARRDPRLSIAERYPSKTDYLAQVRRAAHALVVEGHLLAEDLELVVDQASERYQLLREGLPEPLPAAD
jgi:Alpha/beta hydrolase domain